jgi:hypothetical protein
MLRNWRRWVVEIVVGLIVLWLVAGAVASVRFWNAIGICDRPGYTCNGSAPSTWVIVIWTSAELFIAFGLVVFLVRRRRAAH